MTRVVRASPAGPYALAPPAAAEAQQRVLRDMLSDTGSRPGSGTLLVPLPAVGMSVVAEVAGLSVVGEHRFDRIALATSDGVLDTDPDPEVLAAALRSELIARSGWDGRSGPGAGGIVRPDPVGGTNRTPAPPPGPERADQGRGAGMPRNPVAAVDAALDLLRSGLDRQAGPGGAAAPADGSRAAELLRAELTDVVLNRGLLPRVAGGIPGRDTELARLAALVGRLRSARDVEPPGPVRDLLQHWLTAPHLWFRPVLHPAPWLRRPNPLLEPAIGPIDDPPMPGPAGEFRFRPARSHGDDLATVARWMRRPEVVRFFGRPWPDERWARELASHGPGSGTRAVLVERDGEPGPVAYVEVYRPARHALARSYPTAATDLGVHVCVGAGHRRGTGAAVLDAVALALGAAERDCTRVLAELDARNSAALGAFRRAGYRATEAVALPHQDSVVMVRALRGEV